MKVRNGFVSNSSSSSFCLFGVCKNRDEWNKILGGDVEEGYTGDKIDYLLSDSFLSYAFGLSDYSDDDIIVGAEPEVHRENFKDKTFVEYEEIIQEEIKKIFGVGEYNLDYHSDGGYCG